MISTRMLVSIPLAAMLCACAAPADHFYRLDLVADATGRTAGAGGEPPAAPTLLVRLNLTIPTLIDRPQLVLDTAGNGLVILEHERWGEALSDQVAHTVARDIERRRGDILVDDGRFDQSGLRPVTLRVDIVRMSAQRTGAVLLDAHWRIVDPHGGLDLLGVQTFTADGGGADYAGVARGYSQALADLADRLAAQIPAAVPTGAASR